jgi:hypothetical protein
MLLEEDSSYPGKTPAADQACPEHKTKIFPLDTKIKAFAIFIYNIRAL